MADDSLESMTLQLAMGFGQGAGTMLATPGALLAARDAYRSDLEAGVAQWSEGPTALGLQSIEYARVLGSLASAHALGAGRLVIDTGDVEYALNQVLENQVPPNALWPLGPCRITGLLARNA